MARHAKKRNNRGWIVALSVLLAAVFAVGGIVLVLFGSRNKPSAPSAATTTSGETTSTTKESTAVPTTTATAHPYAKNAQELLNTMTLQEKVYQLFIVTQEQLTGIKTVVQSGETSKAAVQKQPVGGIVYFAKNIVSPTQCTDMISGIQSASKIPLFIAVDEEGGTVARLGNSPNMGVTKFPNMGTLTSEDDAYYIGKTIGFDIRKFGFNLNFAPVADVNSNPQNPVIADRSFSSDAVTAGNMVAAAVKGFKESGVLCTLKHFPGHGDTLTDSHQEYTEVDKTLDELRQTEFVPFQSGVTAGADCVMVGHLSLPKITGNRLPATLSKPLIDLLKNEIGFEGLIITDSLSMNVITDSYSAAEAAVMALQAGVDVLLMPEDLTVAANGVVNAVEQGVLLQSQIDASVLKILQTKFASGILS